MPDPKGATPKGATTIPRATLEAKLPGGRKIVLVELTGHDELAVASEAKSDSVAANTVAIWASVMRSLRSIDGHPFDASTHTPESTRALFTPLEWRYVHHAWNELHIPSNDDLESFRKTFRRSAE